MKRFMCILFLCIMSVSLFAAETATPCPTLPQPGTFMEAKISQTLDAIAAGLKVSTEKLWELMIIQAKVTVVTYCINLILSILFTTLFLKILFWALSIPKTPKGESNRYNRMETWDSGIQTFFIIGMLIAGAIVLAVDIKVLVCIPTAVTAWINPGYWVLQDLLTKITAVTSR